MTAKHESLRGIDCRCGTCGKTLPLTTRGRYRSACPDHPEASVSWRATFAFPRVGGKRGKRISFSGSTEDDARAWLKARQAEFVTTGEVVAPSRQPLAEACAAWVESRAGELSTNSYRAYVRAVPHVENDPVGAIPLAKLTTADLRAMYRRWQEAYAVRSVRLWAAVVAGTLTELHAAGEIPRNPSHKALVISKDIAPDDGDVKAWNRQEWNTFLDAISGDELEALWSVYAWTGLRRGEALALTWGDIDMETGVVTVRRSLTDSFRDGRVEMGRTKSGRTRSVQLPAETIVLLRGWHARQAKAKLEAIDWLEDDFVFARTLGIPWKPSTVSMRFARLVAIHDLPRLSLHGLRHTAMTLAVEHGARSEDVQQLAGHAASTTTDTLYVHRGDGGASSVALGFLKLARG